jgi:oligopeptide/dipeptide ABC transporter ATP-binding protein
MTALLHVANLVVGYGPPGRAGAVVDTVSFEINAGETLAVVGESGSGKSSLARGVAQLVRPHAGNVVFDGAQLTALNGSRLVQARGGLAMVFQDPVASLDPRFTVEASVAEPLRVHAPRLKSHERRQAVVTMLSQVGLGPEYLTRHPHSLSGGQCQRVAIARAMITRPKLVICDEPTSALDVSVQARILMLLQQFQREQGTAYLFITHDLAVVRQVAARVLVMYQGQVMEYGTVSDVWDAPRHPYTELLLRSARSFRVEAREAASARVTHGGCVFQNRCMRAQPRCTLQAPTLSEVHGRASACWEPIST